MAVDPPDFVSLEVLDDVAAEKKGSKKLVEQDKSYLSSNPLSDRAVALWKALRNWVDAVQNGKLNAKATKFLIYAPKAVPGEFAKCLAAACCHSTVATAIKRIREMAQEEQGAEWQGHAQVVSQADESNLKEIVHHLEIDTPTGAPADTLPPLFAAKLISPDLLDDAIKWAHGWVKSTVDSLLESGTPACLSYTEFHSALLGFVKTHDRLVVLRSYAGSPTSDDVDNHLAFRRYVRQLRIIDLPDVDVFEAVNDYLRSSIDRTEWARRGFITESSLSDFERELIVTWRNKQRKVSLSYPHSAPVDQGQLLYADCIDHSLPLEGLATPPAFLRGSLHSIADDCTIGWHPEFEALLADSPAGSMSP
jgi:hypothetical protein